MKRYAVGCLKFPWKASKRDENLTMQEIQKRDCRIIGGNKGDVQHQGYDVDDTGTELRAVVVVTAIEGLTTEEATELAYEVIEEAYASIGAECVEHS